MSLPSPEFGTFSKIVVGYKVLTTPPVCPWGACPPGTTNVGTVLDAHVTLDGGAGEFHVPLAFGDWFVDEFTTYPAWFGFAPAGDPNPTAYRLECFFCGGEDHWFGEPARDDLRRMVVYLFSGLDPATTDPGKKFFACETAPPGGWATGELVPQTVPSNYDVGVMLDAAGKAFRGGCTTTIDTTFRVVHNAAQYDPVSGGFIGYVTTAGTARVTGTICAPNPCAPPQDATRYWCRLTRTYPYVERVEGESIYALSEKVPAHSLSGPHFRPYVVDVGPPDCEGHHEEVDCDEIHPEYTPVWGVRYQNRDAEGNAVGNPYYRCHPSRLEGIVCERWDKYFGCLPVGSQMMYSEEDRPLITEDGRRHITE